MYVSGIARAVRKGSNSASGISPTLPPSIHTLLIAALSRSRRRNWANRSLPQTMSRTASHYSSSRCISVKTLPRRGLLKMLTPVQQHAVDQFAKSLPRSPSARRDAAVRGQSQSSSALTLEIGAFAAASTRRSAGRAMKVARTDPVAARHGDIWVVKGSKFG
jgi:hypothetical protein